MVGRALLTALTALATLTAAAAPLRSNARIATGGDGYLVVWTEQAESGSESIHGARLTRTGVRHDRTFRVADGRVESLLWIGEHYLAFTHHEADVSVLEIDRDGVTRTHAVQRRSNAAITSAAMALHGRTLMVMTNHGRDFVDLDGPQMTFSENGPSNREQAAAVSSEAFFYIFTTDRGDTGYGTRSIDGRSGDSCCARIPEVPPDGDTGSTGATNGTQFLMIRMKQDRRMAAGILNSRSRFTAFAEAELGVIATHPRAAWHGSEYLLGFISDGRLNFWRLSNAAVPIGSPMPGDRVVAGGAADITSGAVAWTREDNEVRVGLFDAVALAAGSPFHTITDVTRVATRRRAVR